MDDKQTDGKNTGGNPRLEAVAEIERKARKTIGHRGPGRPPGSGAKKSPVGGGAVDNRIPPGDLGPAAAGQPAPAVSPSGIIHAEIVECIQGYRDAGLALTGHEHWKIERDRAEVGARTLEAVLGKLPPERAASIIEWALTARSLVIGWEIIGKPVYQSFFSGKRTGPGEQDQPAPEASVISENGANGPDIAA